MMKCSRQLTSLTEADRMRKGKTIHKWERRGGIRSRKKRMRSKSWCSWASWSVSAGNESKKWPTPNDCHLTIATSLCGLIIIYRLITKMMMMVVIGLRLMMAVILTTMTMTFMQSRIQAIWRCVLMDLCPVSLFREVPRVYCTHRAGGFVLDDTDLSAASRIIWTLQWHDTEFFFDPRGFSWQLDQSFPLEVEPSVLQCKIMIGKAPKLLPPSSS